MLTPKLASETGFAAESRVWVYTSNRSLTDTEVQSAQAALDHFTHQWTAHNQALKAAAEVYQNQFIILMVDESQAGASGCSIDKSVHFLEALGQKMGVDLFERMQFAWAQDDSLRFSNRLEFSEQVKANEIKDTTLMVNTLVENKKDLKEKWLIPFSQSWHRRLV